MDGGGVFGAFCTIDDFDGEAHAFTDTTQTLDAFGSGFADDFALGQSHDLGVELSVACDEIWVQGHGPDDAFEVEVFPGGELGVEGRHLVELKQIGGGTAVVAGDDDFVRWNFQEFGEFVEDELLDGVVAL